MQGLLKLFAPAEGEVWARASPRIPTWRQNLLLEDQRRPEVLARALIPEAPKPSKYGLQA